MRTAIVFLLGVLLIYFMFKARNYGILLDSLIIEMDELRELSDSTSKADFKLVNILNESNAKIENLEAELKESRKTCEKYKAMCHSIDKTRLEQQRAGKAEQNIKIE